ncbi:MAG: glycosyltransferase family 2 protein [Lachnospiraceae bacterium]|nr:glycosyltransferase family 2 protein [Lachnospiraceae bacterium]
MKLTILTPTYNRAYELQKLYDSLKKQSVRDFIWMIVDDGSTDSTEDTVSEIQKSVVFPVFYIKKQNGGKHTALNTGIRQIKTELVFIVDSDDWLAEDAVETVLRYHERYKKKEGICGYSFLRKFPDGSVNGKLFEPDEKIASYIEVRINGDDTYADKAEIFFTACLQEFPFPEYTGERFLGEDLIWIRMARKYNMVHINKAIYIGNYMSNGLTRNRRRNNINSPIGCMQRACEFMQQDMKLKYRIKGGLQYIIYGKFAGFGLRDLLLKSHFRILTAVCMGPGVLIYIKWKHDMRQDF